MTSKIFSLEGKGLKLTTAEEIEPHIKELRENDGVEEIRFLGNTLGIGASEALAKVLETRKKLKVCLLSSPLLLKRAIVLLQALFIQNTLYCV